MLVAEQLGNKPLDPEPMIEAAAQEGRRHEPWIAEDLRKKGYKVTESPGVCAKGCDREGFHVEYELDGHVLRGHLDRIASKNDKVMFGEFKALSRFRSSDLIQAIDLGLSELIHKFPEYAFQIAGYHLATGWPCLYAIKNRDTGELTVRELNGSYYLDTEALRLKIAAVEQWVKAGKLPVCDLPEGDFFRDRVCPFRYMSVDPMNVPWDTYDPTQQATITPEKQQELTKLAEEYAKVNDDVTKLTTRQDEIKGKFAEIVNDTHKRHYIPISAKRVVTIAYVAGYTYDSYPKEALTQKFGAALKGVAKPVTRDPYIKVEVKEDGRA